jgi:hypothetical protein
MTAPLAMWEVQYSWAAPGKTDREEGTYWVLTTSAVRAARTVAGDSPVAKAAIVVYQVICRSSGDLLIDWDAVSYHWRNEEETLLAEEIDFKEAHDRHVSIVLDALVVADQKAWADTQLDLSLRETAEIAVTALENDGVVFARMDKETP